MKTAVVVVAVAILAVVDLASSRTLPSYIPICKRNDPKLDSCVRKATVTVMPFLAKGIPELKIPSMEPLTIPKVNLEQGTQAVNYKINLTDVKISGLSNYHFTDMKVDLDNLMITGLLDLPGLSIEANYALDGRVLLLPIKGEGVFIGSVNDTKAQIHMKGALKDKKGMVYYENKHTDLKLNFGKTKLNLSNLFGGDEIGQVTNKFINDNSEEIVREVGPAVETVASMLVDDIANKVFRTVTFAELFPES